MTAQAIETGQTSASIRDNALILYFDKAETPFVARYDLASLAQANFEVLQKNDGTYILSLRDYAGRAQEVGEFATKADAHQALYLILQAFLQHKDIAAGSSAGRGARPCGLMCRIGCFLLRFLKWVLMLTGALVLLYVLLGMIPAPRFLQQQAGLTGSSADARKTAGVTTDSTPAPQTAQHAGQTDINTLPEGEAVDADSLLAPRASVPQPARDDRSQAQDQQAE